jgi:hypothetical protein
MISKFHHIVWLILLFITNPASSQNLTGSWEGESDNEFFQVNIVQEKQGEICGYTYDHSLYDRRSYCRAYFKGSYNTAKKRWDITGLSFISNSGSHVLMRIILWKDFENGDMVLSGIITAKSSFLSILSFGSKDYVLLRRVSRTPVPLPGNMPTCFPDPDAPQEPDKPKEPPVTKPVPKRALPADTIVVKPPVIKKPVDPPIVKIEPKKESIPLPPAVKERKNNTFSRLTVNVKDITLSLYDNAVVDGDTISVFYNGRLLVNKLGLSEKPIVVNLHLDENASQHEITLFAHNLGAIPPNTALIVVTAGEKRYELHASSNLEQNAVLVFEYVPK